MNYKSVKRILFLGLWILLFTVSCGGSKDVEDTTTPFIISTPTESSMPTFTPTPMPTHTPTPLPTLLPDEKYALIEELMITNGGCKLPCWWGITPGETRWEDAERLLQTFTYVYPGVDYGKEFIFQAKFQILQHEYVPSHYFRVKEGIIESIEADPDGIAKYNLEHLFTEYGKPDEVYIYYLSERHNGALPFGIEIFFKTKGILTSYWVEGQEAGDMIQGCFGKEIGTHLLMLWPPERDWTLDEVTARLVDHSFFRGIPLEESTGMDIETFYQTFKSIEGEECILVPK